jgi:hypothetical protein
MVIDQFVLSLKDSEGGDYCRVYSKYHQCEFYIHKDTEITFINYDWCDELGGPGYKVVKTGHLTDGSEPFFVPAINCEWICAACNNRYSSLCEKDIKFPPSKCLDCEDNREYKENV